MPIDKKKRTSEILHQIDNATFDDHEGNIEHIDMDTKKFIALLKELAKLHGAEFHAIKR